MNLIEELKRRKVLKTLGVYGAAALVISQLVATVFPYLFLPAWTITFIIILLIIGFPITFFLSWTYELKQETGSNNKIEETKKHTNKWNFTKKIFFPITGFILMVLGGAFWFIYPFLSISMGHDNKEYDASIAILYMENMSSEENSYFADGLTEELINRLSRIQNLKVRPRTDVAVYKNNKMLSINEIAKDLGVNYIVEGAVTVAKNKLRVNAKLFDIAQDNITWSDSYKRELTDLFEVQDDIASKIVAKLNEKLTITKVDIQATERTSTENLEAYNLVMQAFEYTENPIYSRKVKATKIEPLALKAIKLDSTYADAYVLASLALMYKWIGVSTKDDPELRKQELADYDQGIFYLTTAIQYDKGNYFAQALKIVMPFFRADDSNNLLMVRSMIIDANILMQKNPDFLFSKFIYGMIVMQQAWIEEGQNKSEKYQESLDILLEVYNKIKQNNFEFTHPSEAIIFTELLADIPNLYYGIGKPEEGLKFYKENKAYICGDNTFECLDITTLNMIGARFYSVYEYEHAIEILNIIFSRSDEYIASVGGDISDKIHPYYKYGMIYMKWGEFDKAMKGFSKGLALLLEKGKDKSDFWVSTFYRRLGLVSYFMKDYNSASKYFSDAIITDEDIIKAIGEIHTIKAICSSGLIEALIGNNETAKNNITECTTWIAGNINEIKKDEWASYGTYEIIWPVHLYYLNKNNTDEALKYLQMAYELIDKKEVQAYHEHPERDTNPEFFYSRDIITTYESSLNQ